MAVKLIMGKRKKIRVLTIIINATQNINVKDTGQK